MAPEVDLQAEVHKLRALNHDLTEAERNRDLAATLAFFVEESILQPPGGPQVEGLAALRAFLEAMFQPPMDEMDGAPTRIVVSAAGDMAYDVGWYRMPAEGPEGRTMEEGKYTIVWQKHGGEWKYMVGCFNANGPGH